MDEVRKSRRNFAKSNDELKELADQQEEHKNIENCDYEEEQKELSTAFLKTRLATIKETMDQFIKRDARISHHGCHGCIVHLSITSYRVQKKNANEMRY